MVCTRHFILAAFVVVGLAVPAQAELMLGQIDTFADGTTQGWTAGGGPGGETPPFPPANMATGGPAGSGDHFLFITALGGVGPGSKLSTFNLTQWAGDYIDAGITIINMDVRNFGPEDVHLRLLFADPDGGPPSNIAITEAVFLAAGGDWTSISFAVDASSLTSILGDAATALSNATELRLFHNPAPEFPSIGGPPAINTQIGVDNIAAAQVVPEPTSAILAGVGLLIMWIGRAIHRRNPEGALRSEHIADAV